MAQRGLPPEEIKKHLIRLRNLEYLHEVHRFKIWHLRDENREFRKEIKALKLVVGKQQKTINDVKLQIEELRTMVFGKKNKRSESDDDDIAPLKEKTPRTAESYKRLIPKDAEVSETEPHPLSQCSCGTGIIKKSTAVFYEEDIPMPTKKIVREHIVEKGYCPKCGKWLSAIPLSEVAGLGAIGRAS